jgi:hypothetical protein
MAFYSEKDVYIVRVLFIIFITIAAVFIPLLLYFGSSRVSGNELVLQKGRALQFYGKVDSMYNDRTNHNARTLILSDKTVYSLYPSWESKISAGDSLSKQGGADKVFVYKRSGIKDSLDYNQLIKELK